MRGDDVFDRKLTHWQFPVLFLDTKRKSLEGGRAVLAAAAQYGYEIKEKLSKRLKTMTRVLSLLIKRAICFIARGEQIKV